jgi:hypothetical protein
MEQKSITNLHQYKLQKLLEQKNRIELELKINNVLLQVGTLLVNTLDKNPDTAKLQVKTLICHLSQSYNLKG